MNTTFWTCWAGRVALGSRDNDRIIHLQGVDHHTLCGIQVTDRWGFGDISEGDYNYNLKFVGCRRCKVIASHNKQQYIEDTGSFYSEASERAAVRNEATG